MRNPMLPGVHLWPAADRDGSDAAAFMADAFSEPQVVAFFRAHRGLPKWDPDCAVVAVQTGAVIGVATWAQDETLGVVTGVAVRADRRRFGVASALLCALVDRLRDDGLTLLEATVGARLPGACRLFEGEGFREVERSVFSGETSVHFERYLRGRRNRKSQGYGAYGRTSASV